MISKILNPNFLLKIVTKSTFLKKHPPAPPNFAIAHLLVYSRPILANFSVQNGILKCSYFFPIIKSVFSLYNLKQGGDAKFSTDKF